MKTEKITYYRKVGKNNWLVASETHKEIERLSPGTYVFEEREVPVLHGGGMVAAAAEYGFATGRDRYAKAVAMSEQEEYNQRRQKKNI